MCLSWKNFRGSEDLDLCKWGGGALSLFGIHPGLRGAELLNCCLFTLKTVTSLNKESRLLTFHFPKR